MEQWYPDIMKRVADKHKVDVSQVEKIILYQFEYLKKTMEKKENESLRLIGLGTFRVKRRMWWYELFNRKTRLGERHLLELVTRLSIHGLFPGMFPIPKRKVGRPVQNAK
jgi:hypothetical protein